MPTSLKVSFAKAVCRFEGFGSSSFCDSWQWKLDPYRCLDKSQDYYELIFRNGSLDSEALDFSEKIYEVQDGFFLRQVFRLSKGETLWRYVRKSSGEVLLSYIVDSAWSQVTLCEDYSNTAGHMAFEYLGYIFPACGLKMDMLTFHGVLLEYKGYGLIISASSGTGKTTHARLWQDEKHALILNGDRAVCRKIEGKWTGFGLPWSGTSGEQINRSVPIKIVVVLERKEVNRAFPISGEEALAGVLSNLQWPTWDVQLTGKAMDLLDDFLRHVSVIRLQCRPDKEAVEVLEKALLNL